MVEKDSVGSPVPSSIASPIIGESRESSDGVDGRLVGLVARHREAIQLQKSIKKEIKDLLREKEERAKKKEDEAHEAWLRAQKEREELILANVLLKEEMKKEEMDGIDDEEEEEQLGMKVTAPIASFSPAIPVKTWARGGN